MRKLKGWATLVLPLFVACSLALAACGSGDIKDEDYKFNNLYEQIAAVEVKLADAQSGLDNLSLLSAETDAALQAQIDVLTADLAALEARVTANEEDIGVLRADLDALEVRVGDVETRLSVLEAYIVKVNSPLFASVVITEQRVWIPVYKKYGYWDDVQDYGATIVWTASAGGDTASSYNVYAVVVDDTGALGLPFKLANGTGSKYVWDGHVDGLPLTFDTGSNPTPLNTNHNYCKPDVYRFAVTAVDENGNESAPAVTSPGETIKVYPVEDVE
jgi:hypothetical protein